MTKPKGIYGSFASFTKEKDKDPFRLKPITTEFSKGSVPDSLSTINRESAWSRWRRGYELATATFYDNDFTYPFEYQLPTPSGSVDTAVNPYPIVSGVFVGFPTTNRDLGMHWSVWRYAGSTRTDKLKDPVSKNLLSVASVTEDSDNWYVTLSGTWSSSNPLPAPFYITVPGQTQGLTPMNTEIFEDRIISVSGELITADTINPNTQTRYGYVQAVLINTNPFTGVLTFKKAGSVQITFDKEYITPSNTGFTVGRFLNTGSRFSCSCQDFTHRDYRYLHNTVGKSSNKIYPRSSIASVKPGRFEQTSTVILSTPVLFDAITANGSTITVQTTSPPSVNTYISVQGTNGQVGDGFYQITSVNPEVSFTYKIKGNAGVGSILNPGVTLIFEARSRILNTAMVPATQSNTLNVYSPSGYTPGLEASLNNVDKDNSTRDNPGIYREFGATYLRSTSNPGVKGAKAEGLPKYEDYSTKQAEITSLTDNWTPLLDEMRYCKHIYALRFKDGVFPPEPSDFPTQIESMAKWEQNLVDQTEDEQQEFRAARMTRKSLSLMDVPPYNCQSANILPFLQKLFNVPASYIVVENFTMFDKNGNPYTP